MFIKVHKNTQKLFRTLPGMPTRGTLLWVETSVFDVVLSETGVLYAKNGVFMHDFA